MDELVGKQTAASPPDVPLEQLVAGPKKSSKAKK
jgi:hypothetical protein